MRTLKHPRIVRRQDIRRRGGFTLIELLTVIGIILLVLAAVLPIWSTIFANNSMAQAQNQISSMMNQARSDALYNHQTMGVFSFTDPSTGQVTMTEVQVNGSTLNGGSTTYNLEMAYFVDNSGNVHWYRDPVVIGKNVAVGLVCNSHATYSGGVWTPAAGYDRYERIGAIMFNSSGQLVSIPFVVNWTVNGSGTGVIQTPANAPYFASQQSPLATWMGTLVPEGAYFADIIGSPTLYSGVGVVLYDHAKYYNQFYAVNSGFSDLDLQYWIPSGNPPTQPQKIAEETWIDNNGITLMVSTYNGSLVKVQ